MKRTGGGKGDEEEAGITFDKTCFYFSPFKSLLCMCSTIWSFKNHKICTIKIHLV